MKTQALLDSIDWDDFERVVILSPHLDDAALSCGALLQALRDRISTLVVSISCGTSRRLRTDGSRSIERRKGHVNSRIRRAEDISAMRWVNADFVHLSFADGIYRRSPLTGKLIYRSARERWVSPRIDDMAHVEELYLVLRRLCLDLGRILLISPMGIGHHVDHQIAGQVAVRLAASAAGAELLFYEDFPYVADPNIGRGDHDDPLRALQRLQLKPLNRYAIPVDVEAKMALLQHYTSQIPALFGDEFGMRQRLISHQHLNRASEFYWQAVPINDPTSLEK